MAPRQAAWVLEDWRSRAASCVVYQLRELDDKGRIEALREPLPTLRDFVLPGGTRAAAACHLARAVCRRAERSLVALGRVDAVSALSIQYLNRLSDLLFLAARTINTASGSPEVIWKPGREADGT